MHSAETNPSLLEGEWKFTGYYPEDCKPLPDCHTFKMELGKHTEDDYGHMFTTKAMMRGDTCPLDAKSYNDQGFT